MTNQFYERIVAELRDLDDRGLLKPERILTSPQDGSICAIAKGGDRPRDMLNFCANNYLGLANDPRVVEASIAATREFGAGVASVRFICGTQSIHKDLERKISGYLGMQDAILFAAAFDANGGVFEPLLGEDDAIISDSLNHASLIDGIRLTKAARYRFANGDLQQLEDALKTARSKGARTILIATDGVFSMDGSIADLAGIVRLAKTYDALTLVDDCHATGVIGPQGRGTPSHCGVEGEIDIITGTFGKALGGSMGGFVAARQEVVDLLRQQARPYLFSNALAPSIIGASLEAIRIAQAPEGDALRQQLRSNAALFRSELQAAGFELLPGNHPIIPVMVHDAEKARELSRKLFDKGIYVTAFSFPVVPAGKARIRTQLSAAHTGYQITQAASAFASAAHSMGLIG